MKNLEDVLKFLDSIENINRGGCAIAALAVVLWLEKQNEQSEIVYCYDRDDLYHQNCKRITENSGEARACMHAIISYNGDFYDSRGRQFDIIENYKHIVPRNIVIESINNVGDWNWRFNRKNVIKIDTKLNTNLCNLIIYEND